MPPSYGKVRIRVLIHRSADGQATSRALDRYIGSATFCAAPLGALRKHFGRVRSSQRASAVAACVSEIFCVDRELPPLRQRPHGGQGAPLAPARVHCAGPVFEGAGHRLPGVPASVDDRAPGAPGHSPDGEGPGVPRQEGIAGVTPNRAGPAGPARCVNGRCERGRIWKTPAMLSTLRNAQYGLDGARTRSRGGADGVFLLDRGYLPRNELMRKLFDRFLDRPDPLVAVVC